MTILSYIATFIGGAIFGMAILSLLSGSKQADETIDGVVKDWLKSNKDVDSGE